MAWTKDRVEAFVKGTQWNGYQELRLPYGIVVPGVDRRPTFDLIYPDGCQGLRVLDVGCHYGAILHMALAAGARAAVGIEARAEYAQVARVAADIVGDGAEVVSANIETASVSGSHDDVLALNVLHHLHWPAYTLEKLAKLAHRRLVIEWATLATYQDRFGARGKWPQHRRQLPEGLEGYHVMALDPFSAWWVTQPLLEALLVQLCGFAPRKISHQPSPHGTERMLTICSR